MKLERAPLASLLVLGTAVLAAACGGSDDATTSSSPSRLETPPQATAGPAADRPAANPPANRGPIGACRVGEKVLVAEGRGSPRVVVGATRVAVVDRARTRLSMADAACETPSRISVAGLDLRGLTVRTSSAPCEANSVAPAEAAAPSAAAPTPVPAPEGGETASDEPASGEASAPEASAVAAVPAAALAPEPAARPVMMGTLFADVERAGGELYAMECQLTDIMDPDELDVTCNATGLSSGTQAQTGGAERVEVGATRFGFQASTVDDLHVVMVGVGNVGDGGGVFAAFGGPSGLRGTTRLGQPPSAVDLDDPSRFVLEAHRDPASNLVIDHGLPTGTRRLRTVLGPDGRVVSYPASATVERAPAEAIATSTERTRGQAAAVRLVLAGIPHPITGLDPEVARFASDFVVLGERLVLVFSEGTGRSTRIRAGVVDPTTKAVVGGVFDVSTTGHEAGYASVDSYDGRTFVAWDEKVGATWSVFVAPLTCE